MGGIKVLSCPCGRYKFRNFNIYNRHTYMKVVVDSLVMVELQVETREKGSACDKAECRRVYGLVESPSQGYVGSS